MRCIQSGPFYRLILTGRISVLIAPLSIILFRRILFCALEKRGNQNVYFLIGGNQCVLLKRVKSMSTFEEGRNPCVLYTIDGPTRTF